MQRNDIYTTSHQSRYNIMKFIQSSINVDATYDVYTKSNQHLCNVMTFIKTILLYNVLRRINVNKHRNDVNTITALTSMQRHDIGAYI